MKSLEMVSLIEHFMVLARLKSEIRHPSEPWIAHFQWSVCLFVIVTRLAIPSLQDADIGTVKYISERYKNPKIMNNKTFFHNVS